MPNYNFSKNFHYQHAGNSTCLFEHFDEQLAHVIMCDETFCEEDFDETERDMTRACIQDMIENRFESIGYTIGKNIPEDLVNSVYDIIEEMVCC